MLNFFHNSYIFFLIEKLINFINSIFFILLLIALSFALVFSPPDYLQGDSVRIMYVHVPAAWISLASFSCIAILSILNFIFKIKNLKLITKSIAPIGLMFTCIAIVTGSIWGRPTWGTFWAWDARITSMVIMALFYLVLIVIYKFFDEDDKANKISSIIAVIGLINIQFAIKEDEIYVLEVNPRASRTVPFVSKATGLSVAKIASRVMAGERLSKFSLKKKNKHTFAVKEAVFPFNKFPEVDVLLGPEMKSTGEAMGFDNNFGLSFAKSQIASNNSIPLKGNAFISVKDSDKDKILNNAKKLIKFGFSLFATSGTARYLITNGVKCKKINKVNQGSPHIVERLNKKNISLVINTTEGKDSISDSFSLRRTSLVNKIPYFTTIAAANASLESIEALKKYPIKVRALQDN